MGWFQSHVNSTGLICLCEVASLWESNNIYFICAPCYSWPFLSSARGWSAEVKINGMSQVQPRVEPASETSDYRTEASAGFDCD